MRPNLELRPKDFRQYYYLKEELSAFCRANGLPAGGGKEELTERVARYMETGEKLAPKAKTPSVCTQELRAQLCRRLGGGFRFFQGFIHWLRENPSASLEEKAEAYLRLKSEGRHRQNPIAGACRYNAYLRVFFADNKNRTLKEAIACWNYKKRLPGTQTYEPSDLRALLK